MWVVVAIVVAIVVTAWFNFLRYRGCARCPGTYSRREYYWQFSRMQRSAKSHVNPRNTGDLAALIRPTRSMSLKVWRPGLLAESGREARVGYRPLGGGFAVHSKKYSNQRWSKSTIRRELPQNLYRLGIVSMGIIIIPWTLFAVEPCTRPHDPTHTSYSSNTTYWK